MAKERRFRSWCIIAAATLTLGACANIPKTASGAPDIAVIKTATDQKVKETADTLKAACAAISLGVDLWQTFNKNAKVAKALADAEVAIDSYCRGPTPEDIPGALAAIGRAYAAIQAARNAAPA